MNSAWTDVGIGEMADWVAALASAGLGFSGAVLVREWLIVRVSIWSLTTVRSVIKTGLLAWVPPPAEVPADPPEVVP